MFINKGITKIIIYMKP